MTVWITVTWLSSINMWVIGDLNHVHLSQVSCEKMIVEVFVKSKTECREIKVVDITK